MAPDQPRPDPLVPHPARLSPDHPRRAAILDAHRRAVETGAATYRDPATGLLVITAAEHLRRTTCCNSGCRHCPYC